ncbi:MAG: DUF2071 domain-containing protein [Phycisphaeraceae bacterium]
MTMKFAMTGRVTDCVQLTYRTPSETVCALLPEGLELVTRGPWAFWNVMACRVEKARPTGVPAFCGLTYCHVAYRLLVQAMNDRAEVVRGFYFVRSDADARTVTTLGNRLSDFKLHPASITLDASDCGVRCAVRETAYAQGDLELDVTHAPARLATGSCFPTLEDARRFARHTPDGLSVLERDARRLLRTTRVTRNEQARCETPVVVRQAKLGYFDAINQSEHAQIEWACRLGAMDVRWQVGEAVGLLQQPTRIEQTIRVAG